VLGRAIAWVAAERALLDLRTAEAYESAHLKGSSSLPYSLLLVRSTSPSHLFHVVELHMGTG
jgi:rhodanese-related sulfurtransferase